MNATITTQRRDTRSAAPTCLAVVVAAPPGMLADCDRAIAGALSRGARTFTCEVPTSADGEVREDEFGIAIDAIAAALDRAAAEVPGLPIVLVGHAEAGLPARMYADLCPDELAGVVITEKTNHVTAA